VAAPTDKSLNLVGSTAQITAGINALITDDASMKADVIDLIGKLIDSSNFQTTLKMSASYNPNGKLAHFNLSLSQDNVRKTASQQLSQGGI